MNRMRKRLVYCIVCLVFSMAAGPACNHNGEEEECHLPVTDPQQVDYTVVLDICDSDVITFLPPEPYTVEEFVPFGGQQWQPLCRPSHRDPAPVRPLQECHLEDDRFAFIMFNPWNDQEHLIVENFRTGALARAKPGFI